MLENIFKNLETNNKIVLNVANAVTTNDVAQSIAMINQSPLMTMDATDFKDLIKIANAVTLNLGTPNYLTENIINTLSQTEVNVPIIVDPVGFGASSIRVNLFNKIFDKATIIKGNFSEIQGIVGNSIGGRGIDVREEDKLTENNRQEIINSFKSFAKKYNKIIVATGEIDIITNGLDTYLVKNGHSSMEKIIGTGCILTGIIGGFVSVNNDILLASVGACVLMSIAGQLSYKKSDNPIFQKQFLMSYLNSEYKKIKSYINLEKC